MFDLAYFDSLLSLQILIKGTPAAGTTKKSPFIANEDSWWNKSWLIPHFKSRFGVFLVVQKENVPFCQCFSFVLVRKAFTFLDHSCVFLQWFLVFVPCWPSWKSIKIICCLFIYLEVLNKAKCASVGRSNCIKRVNGTGSFISTLPMHSGSEKVSMSRHVGLIWQLRVAVCPIRCSFVVVSRSSAQRVKQHPRGHHKWPKSDFFFFPL